MNNRKTGIVLILVVLMSVLTGCGAVDSVKQTIREALVEKQAEIYGEQFESVSEEAKETVRGTITEMDYAFSRLAQEEQELYLELLAILTSYQEEAKLSSMDPDAVDRIYQTIMMDHPELFYLDGYTITRHTIAEEVAFYTFSGQYNRTWEEKEALTLEVEETADKIIKGISDAASDYEKVKYVYEYIVRNTLYDEDSEDNQNILSVLLNQASVCQGYAYATQYLLHEMGIPCTTVAGTAASREGNQVTHAWNLVYIEDSYYYVDTTWGDPVTGRDVQAAELVDEDYVNYDYLNLTTAQISRDHEADVPVELPDCDSETYNYYRMEGLFYETYDRGLVKERIAQAKETGKDHIVMKFPDESVYQQHIDRLFEGQEIFQITPEFKRVSYTADPESCLLILYLADS